MKLRFITGKSSTYFSIELNRNVRPIRLELLRFTRNLHLLTRGTQLKLAIDTGGSVGRHRNIFKLNYFESLRFDTNGVRIRNQMGYIVIAALVGRGPVGGSFTLVDHRDFCIGERQHLRGLSPCR